MFICNSTLRYCLFYILFLLSIVTNANISRDSIAIAKIDSLYKISRGKYDDVSYKNLHFVLSEAKKYNALVHEMESYRGLAWFHGNNPTTKRRLDSALYYFHYFETKLHLLDSLNTPFYIAGRYTSKESILAAYYLNKGNVLANRFGFIDLGLKTNYKAYKYLDSLEIDFKIMYNVYLSQLYTKKKQYKKAIKILKNSLKDTIGVKLSIKLSLLQNLAESYKKNLNIDESLKTNIEVVKLSAGLDEYKWWSKNEICYDYYKLGDVKKAIDSALVTREYYKKNIDIDALFNNAKNLSVFYREYGDLDLALDYAFKSLENKYLINEFPEVYTIIASIYSKKNNFDKANYYLNKKSATIDTIWKRSESLFSEYMIINDKVLEEKKKNEKSQFQNAVLSAKNQEQKLTITFLLTSLIGFFLLVLCGFMYSKYKSRGKIVASLKENEKKLLNEQLLMKDNELDAAINFISKRVVTLNSLKQELDNSNFTDKEKIESTSKVLSDFISKANDISIVTDKLTSRYSALTLQLKNKHDYLSPRDIDYCLLTKLELSLKETAAILNVSPGTVKVTRSRLKTKMKIPSDVTLKEYLETIVV